MRIYIAAPYSAPAWEERLANINVAMDAAIQLLLKGHAPYCPHLTGFVEERAFATGIFDITYQDWLEYDRVWLWYCDALLYLAASPGADEELAQAKKRGIVIYTSVEDVPDVSGRQAGNLAGPG